MELEYDANTDEKMDDSRDRYMRLHAIVEEIKSGSPTRTTEWYTEHNHLLAIYERHFYDFKNLHPEIENVEFRAKCEHLSMLIDKLMNDFRNYSWFGLYDYMKFNESLIWVVDYVFEVDDTEDELGAMFDGLTV
jgi:hypothetical protein